jgi:hypothetical protein
LLREFNKELSGEEPGPTIGRGIEVIKWKIITGETDEGEKYYIACAFIQVPVKKVGIDE